MRHRHFHRLAFLFLGAVLFLSTACGDDSTVGPPSISISTNTITLSSVLLNSNTTVNIPVTNDGEGTLKIEDVVIDPLGVITVNNTFPIVIDSNQTVNISLTLNVTTSEPINGTVTIMSNVGSNPEITINFAITTLAYENTQDGWTDYEAGNYQSAQGLFSAAVGLDPDWGDAHSGLGWSNLRLDDLTTAITNFSNAITSGAANDGHAGKAFAELNSGNYANAITDVDAVVTISGTTVSDYSFSHDSSINDRDLVWIKARAHFLLAQYTSAQTAVDVLDPANTLDPLSATYIQDLADVIEQLRTVVL